METLEIISNQLLLVNVTCSRRSLERDDSTISLIFLYL